jgi:hypothetical protein
MALGFGHIAVSTGRLVVSFMVARCGSAGTGCRFVGLAARVSVDRPTMAVLGVARGRGAIGRRGSGRHQAIQGKRQGSQQHECQPEAPGSLLTGRGSPHPAFNGSGRLRLSMVMSGRGAGRTARPVGAGERSEHWRET